MKKVLPIFIFAILALSFTIMSIGCSYVERSAMEEAYVVEVIDGDTIKVDINGQKFRVRYIGIDTPETVHPSKPVEFMGKEASAKNTELVFGKKVFMERDVQDTDKYGRLLRYVWVDPPGGPRIMVNAELVRLGYAQVSTYAPNVRNAGLFLEMQREAKKAKRGLWSQ